MRNAGLEEAQAGIKTARRNINNLRYADDTTLMAESEEELKSLLMKGKEESEKVGLKFNIQKTEIMASGPITSWQTDGETYHLDPRCTRTWEPRHQVVLELWEKMCRGSSLGQGHRGPGLHPRHPSRAWVGV